MSAYYYLVATLPLLSLEAAPPWGLDAFREICVGHLTDSDLGTLDSLLADNTGTATSKNDFSARWHTKETLIRNAIAKQRASALHVEASLYLHDRPEMDLYLEKAVSDAFAKGNPMERERALDSIRWQLLNDLSKDHPFALDAILAYALQLRMAERWSSMDTTKGSERLEHIVDAKHAALSEKQNETESSLTT